MELSQWDVAATPAVDQSRAITAQFARRRPSLWASTCLEGYRPEGFRLSIGGGMGETYTVEASADLREWTPLSILTNRYGIVQFLDPAATNLAARFYRVEVEE